MAEWFVKTLQNNPELTIFLGFAVGKIKFKGFTLGNVTSVLLMGVLVDTLKIIFIFVLELSGKGFVPSKRLSILCFLQGDVYFLL